MMRCQVMVAGGGTAGIAAAVAAARAGAETVLVERGAFLGGMATAALVHSLCGLYLLRDRAGAVFANPGFAQEFAERLIAAGASGGPSRCGRLDVLPHHPTDFALLADRLGRETRRLTVLLHTEIIAAEYIDDVWQVHWICRGRRGGVLAGAAIDTTGDAALVELAGLETLQSPAAKLQRPAYVFALGGLLKGALEGDRRIELAGLIVDGVRAGKLPQASLGATFRPSGRAGEAFVTIDLDPPDFDPTDPGSLGAAEILGRETAAALCGFVSESAYVAAWPARAGVRESRRAAGLYRLTDDDIINGATFDDAVALATWPMEMREKANGPRWRFPHEGRPCQIPLRSLTVADADRLYVAGRCLACEHGAQGSIRVMGTCLATGEAAGKDAAVQS